MKVGDPTQPDVFVGAVIDQRRFREAPRRDRRGKKLGQPPTSSSGARPTTLSATSSRRRLSQPIEPDFRCMREEMFGPIMPRLVYPDRDWDGTLGTVDQRSLRADRRHLRARSGTRSRKPTRNFATRRATSTSTTSRPVRSSDSSRSAARRASGTNDKAGSIWNLSRWVSMGRSRRTSCRPRTGAIRSWRGTAGSRERGRAAARRSPRRRRGRLELAGGPRRGLVEAGVEAAAWVPDKRLGPIARALDGGGMPLRTLTREEECFAWAAGYRAAGGMPLVLFQCSGLGNALNAIGSLVDPVRPRLPGGALDARLARRAQPVADAAGAATPACSTLAGRAAVLARRPEDAGVVARGALDVAEGARAWPRSCSRRSWTCGERDDRRARPAGRARRARSSPRWARRRRRCARRATTGRTSTWAARWAPRSAAPSASPRSGRSARWWRCSATARR